MRSFFAGLSLCLILVSGWLAFTAGAVEPVSRNIVYVHVPAAICSLVCFCVLFVCSIQYLRTRRKMWDYAAAASAEVGLVLATVLNVTGSIFAYAQWGVWWTMSPKLVSSGVMLFLYAAYILLRASLADERRREQICAVFGIIAFIDVPFVLISARFVRDIHVPSFSFQSGVQGAAFWLGLAGTLFLAVLLIWIRADILKIEHRISMMDY